MSIHLVLQSRFRGQKCQNFEWFSAENGTAVLRGFISPRVVYYSLLLLVNGVLISPRVFYLLVPTSPRRSININITITWHGVHYSVNFNEQELVVSPYVLHGDNSSLHMTPNACRERSPSCSRTHYSVRV